MSDEAERIRRQMQSVRQELGVDVKEIVDGARQLSDWRCYVRRHPWICAGSAFALGVLATPARRKVLGGDMENVLQQLRASGLAVAATRAAPLAGGGLAGKLVAIAAPIVARHVAAYVVQRFAGDHKSPTAEATPPDAVTP